jgi:hypothetical protein
LGNWFVLTIRRPEPRDTPSVACRASALNALGRVRRAKGKQSFSILSATRRISPESEILWSLRSAWERTDENGARPAVGFELCLDLNPSAHHSDRRYPFDRVDKRHDNRMASVGIQVETELEPYPFARAVVIVSSVR